MAKHKTEDIRNIALVGHGAAGKTSLLDWLRLTSSFGCACARRPITSLAFMFVEVPLPV